MSVQSYKDLVAWQKAMDLAELVCQVTADYPRHEVYGLGSQSRKAATSIPSNIAEGQGRRSTREFLHHLSIAHGSLCELETQILLGARLGYLREDQCGGVMSLGREVGRLVNGLYNSLAPEGEGRGRP